MEENSKLKINDGSYAIAHLATKSVVIVGAQTGERVALTSSAALALAKELANLATLAQGGESESKSVALPMLIANKPSLAM